MNNFTMLSRRSLGWVMMLSLSALCREAAAQTEAAAAPEAVAQPEAVEQPAAQPEAQPAVTQPAAPPEAVAQHEAVVQPQQPRLRRYGIGSAIGAGYAGGTVLGGQFAASLGLLLPSLELRLFNKRGASIDLSIPVSNTIVVGALGRVFVWSTDLFYNFNLGPGGVRFLAAPGVGLSVFAGSGVGGASLRVPAILGVEFLTRGRGFGFQIRGRPHFEIAYAGRGSSAAMGIGGGFMAELAVVGYATAPPQ